MRLTEFKAKKEKVINSIKNIRESITDIELIEYLNTKIEKLEEDKFVISVFGHYSNGKSTFLNALIGFGEEVLVENELPSTATITRLKYAENKELINKARITFKNKAEDIVAIEEIKNYSARNNKYNVEDNVEEVTLYLDSELLKNGIEIVDTPGFNSTYEIHTNTAKAHVNNSDASIFLFSYDKPGAREEFKFLSDVNDKMDRIFLVLNKIDMEDKTESTIENTIDDLKYKINMEGADVKSKIVYPISALFEKEGIKDDNEEKRQASRITEFKEKLVEYLTSEDNIRDRLEAPIKSILARLDEKRESNRELLNKYNLESEKIQEEIRKIKNEVEDLQDELANDKRTLNRAVITEINQLRDNIDVKVSDIKEEINENFKTVNTAFALRRVDFEEEIATYTNNMQRDITDLQKRLVGALSGIIDMNIDDDCELEEIKERLINSIKVKLNINQRDIICSNDIDFTELNEIDKEIKRKENEVQEKKEQWQRLVRENNFNKDLQREIELDEIKLSRLKKEQTDRILNIGDGEVHYYEKEEDVYVSRSGLFGKIAEACVGKKRVTTTNIEADYSRVEQKEKQREAVAKEYEDDINKFQDKIEENKNKIRGNNCVELFAQQAREEFVKTTEDFYDIQLEMEKKKLDTEQEIVDINVKKYKRELKGYITSLADETKANLDKNETTIKRIVEISLNTLERKIALKNKAIDELVFTLNVSPEELDRKIEELSKEIVNINNGINNMCKVRNGVMGIGY